MQLEVGMIFSGKVTGITKFGVFVDIGEGKTGMVHISEVSTSYVKDISDHLSMGDTVKVKVLGISDEGKISLSIKQTMEPRPAPPVSRAPSSSRPPQRSGGGHGDHGFGRHKPNQGPMSFEDMMNKFKASSDEKMNDLKRNMDSKRGSGSRRGSKS